MAVSRVACRFVAFGSILLGGHAAGQSPISIGACGAAPVVDAHAKPNIFSTQQEEWLGEAVRDEIEGDVPSVKNPSLNLALQNLVDRLAKNLPEPHVAFRVVLVESSEANAWSLPGGSIYVTRKLAATAKSEDEMAAVLGHEMGHIASHQFAFEMTAEMQRLLGVKALGDRKDVYSRFQQLDDAERKDKHPPKDREDAAQDEADVIGVYLTAAAGFRAQAFPEFFDREFFLEGKTGSKLTDLFRMTKPDQKRLRGMRAMVETLPKGCGSGESTHEEEAAFLQWRQKVTENRKETTEASIDRSTAVKLDPPLQMEVNRVRFSPDGKFLLAQDDSSIYVLAADTAKVLFRVDADRAQYAWFSPDSKLLTFTTPGLHAERWDIASQKLVDAHEPLAKHECWQTKLSPDGRTIVCVSFDSESWRMNLSLLDSTTGEVVWEKKPFFEPSLNFAILLAQQHEAEAPSEALWSSFSGDGNYLIIGPSSNKVAIDLRTRTPVKIGGDLRTVTGNYAFLGNDRVAGVNLSDTWNSGIYSFPEGKRLQKIALPLPDLASVSDPGDKLYVTTESIYGRLAVPDPGKVKKEDVKNQDKLELRSALVDMETSHFLFGSYSTALDLWRGHVATEQPDGAIALGTMREKQVEWTSRMALPDSRLGALRAVDLSPDGKFLAYSTRDRGGVWDLASGKLLGLLRPFSAVHWTGNATLVGEFEKSAKQDRRLMAFNLASHENHEVNVTVSDDEKDDAHMWYQSFAEWKNGKGHSQQLIYHRLEDGIILWTRDFPDGYPRWTQSYGGQDLIFSFPLNTDAAKSAMAQDAALKAEASAIRKKEDGRLIEVVDAGTGKTLARMVFEMPGDYEGTNGLNRAGDQLYVTGGDNRTLVYSLKTGKQLWQAYGWVRALDTVKQRVCVVNRSDEAIVYDASGQELNHIHAGIPVRFVAFEQQGARLMMLTADQTVRVVDVTAPGDAAK